MKNKWMFILPVVAGVAVVAVATKNTQTSNSSEASIAQAVDAAFERHTRDQVVTNVEMPLPASEASEQVVVAVQQPIVKADTESVQDIEVAAYEMTNAFPDTLTLAEDEIAERPVAHEPDIEADLARIEADQPAVDTGPVEFSEAEIEYQRHELEQQIAREDLVREQQALVTEENLPPMA